MPDADSLTRRAPRGPSGGEWGRALERPTPYTKYLVGVRMSSAGEAMPGLERQRWLDRVAQHGCALEYAPAELKGDREIVLAAVAQHGLALEYAAAELKGDGVVQKLRSLNPRVSAVLLVAQLRLHVAYTCQERVGRESLLLCLPLEVIELIGQHMTVLVALHGLVHRTALLSEGVPPE